MTMVSPKLLTLFFIFLLIFPSIFGKSHSQLDDHNSGASSPCENKKGILSTLVRLMFERAYHSYGKHAFPHDELKPLTRTATDYLSGSKSGQLPEDFHGTSITVIESLSSLLIMGFYPQFKEAVLRLSQNLNFDVDARINLYEWNTRVLGGLVSAHILATDLLKESYNNELLDFAEDLGRRFLPAFDTPTGIPYAWINLKYGVMKNETKRTTTAECGSLILEMGALSRLTYDTRFEFAALRALRKLWRMRSSFDLLGTKLNVVTGKWVDHSSGIGAGIDSFYEYLVKAYVMFGSDEFWTMFQTAYIAVQRHIRYDDVSFVRYKTVDMRTTDEINWQLTSVQAFWPGVQVLIGDIASANVTHRDFFSLWKAYRLLPDRFLWSPKQLRPIERQYPLRPELAESTFYLYQATKDPWYLEVGEAIVQALADHTQVDYGYTSIKDVITMEKEDHQPGYFLSEMCKYLFLLYKDSFLDTGNYVFTTKGHPLPVMGPGGHEMNIPRHSRTGPSIKNSWASLTRELEKGKQPSALSKRVCPSSTTTSPSIAPTATGIESACHVLDARTDHTCYTDAECGVDSFSCVPRECSVHGYCGDLYFENRGALTSGYVYDHKNDSAEVSIFIDDLYMDDLDMDDSYMDDLDMDEL